MASIKAVVSVMGKDQKGVVAKFATYLAEHGVNIEDIQQQVVHGSFLMDMLVDLAELSISLDEMITGLLGVGKSIEMDVRVTLHSQRRRKRVALLVSKEPHCLEKLIENHKSNQIRGDFVCVLSNHEMLKPIAQAAGIPFEFMPSDNKAAHMAWLLERLNRYQADLVVLARYMQIVDGKVVEAYRHRIINIHPSLLPHFPGAAPYKQAWESGMRVTGCTAHFVTESLDEGPIILQDVFHIEVGKDTAEDVKRKGLELESKVLSTACQMFLDEKLVVVDGKVVFRPGISAFLDHEE
ncbi:MAG: formyltetrahydrofolate deformylase [Phycisphaeraceae bacterium]|nr:formyltetrahydrofolate deformylase [Phycisphaeraceae bacterium]